MCRRFHLCRALSRVTRGGILGGYEEVRTSSLGSKVMSKVPGSTGTKTNEDWSTTKVRGGLI